MADLAALAAEHANLSDDAQKKAGKAIAGAMDDEHEHFLVKVLKLLDEKKIDLAKPDSIINQKVYATLPDEWRAKTDMALPNVIDQLNRIVDFRVSKQTPDSSPQLATMIEHLWQMKQRIEEHYDVFVI